jgi:YVTN family beta-propeller protein
MRFLFLCLMSLFMTLAHQSASATQIAYVVNFNDGTVSVINVAGGEVTDTISVGNRPFRVAFTPDGTIAYVTNSGSDTVSVIDVLNGMVITTIPVGDSPGGVAFTPDGTIAYVTNSGGASNDVSVIDVATHTEIFPRISLGGGGPLDVAFTPDGTVAYVANVGGQNVSVIDVATHTETTTIPVVADPTSVDISPDGTVAYVVSSDNTVSVIDVLAGMVIDTIDVGDGAIEVAFSPDGTIAYVTNQAENNVSVIDASTHTEILPRIEVGFSPFGVAFCQDSSIAYITNSGDDNVSAINVATSEETDTISVGNTPLGVAITTLPEFEGIRRTNTFAMQMEFFDELTWTPINNPAIVSYRILEGQTVLGEVSASDPLVFLARNRPKTLSVTYTLQALDENGNIIATFTTTVP